MKSLSICQKLMFVSNCNVHPRVYKPEENGLIQIIWRGITSASVCTAANPSFYSTYLDDSYMLHVVLETNKYVYHSQSYKYFMNIVV